jgi:hypothetical protein
MANPSRADLVQFRGSLHCFGANLRNESGWLVSVSLEKYCYFDKGQRSLEGKRSRKHQRSILAQTQPCYIPTPE